MDIWSLGVILYTLLVGRPPYECKDVKSTYKRILANLYCFPDTVPVSDTAKSLIRCLLQVLCYMICTVIVAVQYYPGLLISGMGGAYMFADKAREPPIS